MNDVLTRLMGEGLLDADKAAQVRDAVAGGKSLDDSLRAVNGVPEEKILRSLAAYFDMPFIDLEKDGAKLCADQGIARASSPPEFCWTVD